MSRRLVVATAVALLAARALAAQRVADPDPRATLLLARAESLSREAHLADSVRRAATTLSRRGQVVRAGRLVAVFWGSVTPEAAQRVAFRADSIVEAFGGGLADLLDSIVGVQRDVSDAPRLMVQPSLKNRIPVELDVSMAASDSLENATEIANRIARHFKLRLDATWKEWLSWDYGVVWRPYPNGAWAFSSLTQPYWSSGAGCLAGRIGECRMWLGLDPTARPMATRYHAADLRRVVGLRGIPHDPDRAACLGSDDAACLRSVESGHGFRNLSRIPATEFARAGVVRAVWKLHGPATVTRALRDTAGGVGARFARAAGISEDSLVAEWRMWTLSGGRNDRLAASLPQTLGVLFAALLVVFLAARSGRWR